MLSTPVNTSELRNKHSRFLADLVKAIDAASQDAAHAAEKYVHEQSGFKHGNPGHPGSIEASVRTRVVRTSNGSVVRIADTAKHAKSQEFGARPHIIRARRAKMLRFVVGGRVVFRKFVRHPGNKPTQFLFRATHWAGVVEFNSLKDRLHALSRRF
jgi:hypothetical protein